MTGTPNQNAAAAEDATLAGPKLAGPLTVALAEAGDLDALATLMAEREAHYRPWLSYPPLAPETLSERIADALFGPRPCAEALVARIAARPAGALYFSELFPGAALARAVFVKDLFVSPTARRLGVGRALLARLRRIARGRGADRVELHTVPDMTEARAFYAAAGFAEADRLVIRVDL